MSPEIVIMRGYPASGKTHASRRDWWFLAHISRDDIRSKVFGLKGKGVLEPAQEQEVTKIQENFIRANIAAGKGVVVDDTNLRARHARRWVDLAVELGVNWNVHDIEADVESCIRQDSKRREGFRVGEEVIRSYAKRFPLGRWPEIKPSGPKPITAFRKYHPNPENPSAYIFDIDGTIADLSHRNPFSTDLYHLDEPFHDIVGLAQELSENHNLIFLSGRSEDFRVVTEEWLYEHVGFNTPLFMRPSGDTRNDAIVKSELFDKHVGPFYNVKGVFDDRLRVARAWHAKGLTLFRVGDPDADF